ncbi:MAG: hypothetical protein B7Z10_11470, partial [Rhodobacterales bacterium 32-66-7]
MVDDTPDKADAKPAPAPRKRKPKPKAKAEATLPVKPSRWRFAFTWARRGLGAVAGFYGLLILLFSFLPPPINLYQISESWRLGGIDKDWVPWEDIAPIMGRAAVAAEDANFCNHWGFDMDAIRLAIEE